MAGRLQSLVTTEAAMYLVSDVMTRDVATVTESDDLAQADETLARLRIRHLPVLRGKKLVGLVSQRDLLRAWAKNGAGSRLPASEAMTRDPLTVKAETPLSEAAKLMEKHKFDCLPVVDAGGALVGIVTATDLVRFAGGVAGELAVAEDAFAALGESAKR